MTDVNVQFTLDCEGHATLTLINHHPEALNAQFNASGSWQGNITVAANSTNTATANFGPTVHDVTGTLSGLFVDGATPIWHPSNHFAAHNAEQCGVTTTVPPTTAPGIVPGVTTVPTTLPVGTTVPETPTTTGPTTTVSITTEPVASTAAVATTQPHFNGPLPTTGGGADALIGGGAGALLIGAILLTTTLRRRTAR